MSPRACRAAIEFARFAGEHGSTLYADEFLRYGHQALPGTLQSTYSGLDDWHGPNVLRDRLRNLAGAHPQRDVVFASRSASLMKFAARLLFRQCRNVLTTDLSWPSYERLLNLELAKTGNRVHKIAILDDLLQRGCTMDEFMDRLVSQYVANKCDGLFLPLVDNRGLRLPVAEIVNQIRLRSELRCCVVDGAQAFRHVPLDLELDYCDFLIAGCHKWLCAHMPMGLGFIGRQPSSRVVADSLARWSRDGFLDDPLLSFSQELLTGEADLFGETAPVLPMLTANAAATDATSDPVSGDQADCRDAVLQCLTDTNWQFHSPTHAFQSRILLLRDSSGNQRSPLELRQHFLRHGIAVTAYDGGVVRLALPDKPMDACSQSRLHAALNCS